MKHNPLVGFLLACMIVIVSTMVLRTDTANIRDVTDTRILYLGRKAGLVLNTYHFTPEDGHGGVAGIVRRFTSRRSNGAIDFPSGCVQYRFDSAGAEILCNVVYHDYEVYCMEIEYPSNRISEAHSLKEAIRGHFHNMRVTMNQQR